MTKFTFLFFALLTAAGLFAQDSLNNGGFEIWRGGYFSPGRGANQSGGNTEKCCGAALAVPEYWGIVEQLMQMPTNHFVNKEIDSANIHSGYFSARLFTDTTTMDSAGDVRDNIGLLVPGLVSCAGIVAYGGIGLSGNLYLTEAYSIGAPFMGRPTALNFYMKMNHPVDDTASYAYALTRWDSVNLKEDTIAANYSQMPDENMPSNEWFLTSDTIQYTQPGLPDTLHLIFFGGKNADPEKMGNSTWLDDISFYYADTTTSPTGLVHFDIDDAVSIYPNPASDVLNVKADAYMAGYVLEVYDLTGNKLMQPEIEGSLSAYNINQLADGVYFCRMLNKNGNQIYAGKFTVAR